MDQSPRIGIGLNIQIPIYWFRYRYIGIGQTLVLTEKVWKRVERGEDCLIMGDMNAALNHDCNHDWKSPEKLK